MFTPPPFLVSYTAAGAPTSWEPPRSVENQFFPFVKEGVRIRHWPDFCPRPDAERMLDYCRRLAPNAQLYDVLNDGYLPPGVARYQNPITSYQMPPYEIGVFAIVGDVPLRNGQSARLYVRAGGMADFQNGLRGGLQESYAIATRMQWTYWGQLVAGENAWPWDIAYAFASPETSEEAQVYWGNHSTGPALGGLAA